MKFISLWLVLVSYLGVTSLMANLYDLETQTLSGQPAPLKTYAGKVALVVNVASKCGYTKQYEGLQQLYTELEPKGLVVLGFPSNDFGGQEPGSAEEIIKFCTANYAVTFPLFAKTVTKGPQKSPIYQFLTAKHGEPQWNFHKYLISKKGEVVAAYPSSIKPDAANLRAAIEAELAK